MRANSGTFQMVAKCIHPSGRVDLLGDKVLMSSPPSEKRFPHPAAWRPLWSLRSLRHRSPPRWRCSPLKTCRWNLRRWLFGGQTRTNQMIEKLCKFQKVIFNRWMCWMVWILWAQNRSLTGHTFRTTYSFGSHIYSGEKSNLFTSWGHEASHKANKNKNRRKNDSTKSHIKLK